jgi:hypothetical protein
MGDATYLQSFGLAFFYPVVIDDGDLDLQLLPTGIDQVRASIRKFSPLDVRA